MTHVIAAFILGVSVGVIACLVGVLAFVAANSKA